MKRVCLAAVLAHAGLAAALAGSADYVFEPVRSDLKVGIETVLELRLVHRPTGRAVADAIVFQTRLDMSPDGMATMAAPLVAAAGSAPGTYAFRTELAMEGRWLLSVAAKVQGESETVVAKIPLRATP